MLQSLLDEYHRTVDSLTEKEKAILERKIWVEAKRIHKSKYPDYRSWVIDGMGEKPNSLEKRARLINFGDWTEPLWKRIDSEGMPVHTCVMLARKAKQTAAQSGASHAEALKKVLENYDSDDSTYVATTPDGKTYRRRRPKTKVKKPKQNGHKEWELEVKNSRELWSLLDSIFSHFISFRLAGLDESVQNDLTKDFTYQLRAVYEDFIKEVNRFRREIRLKNQNRIGVYKLRQACEALGVQTPGRGKPVNMKDVKVRYRKLAARFHPDRNGGKDDMIKQYHAVNEALETIKAYMEGLNA
jgi:hypothetical protein